jgi:hypothetical protein
VWSSTVTSPYAAVAWCLMKQGKTLPSSVFLNLVYISGDIFWLNKTRLFIATQTYVNVQTRAYNTEHAGVGLI